jgi:DNA-binding protein H-NS
MENLSAFAGPFAVSGAAICLSSLIDSILCRAFAFSSEASQTIPFFAPEITMANVNLSGMNVEALMDLRMRVDEMLVEHRAKLIGQLERIAVVGGTRVVRGGGSALKGRKIPPKYRSRSGETWAGRGARPRWLVVAIKGGKKLDDFLIKRPRL